MCVVSGVRRQKFGRIVDDHIINSTLHWAKEMVVKMWDMIGLVDHQLIYLASLRVIMSKAATNGGVGHSAKDWVIAFNNNRFIIVKNNQGIAV